jgi:hypothetical protein
MSLILEGAMAETGGVTGTISKRLTQRETHARLPKHDTEKHNCPTFSMSLQIKKSQSKRYGA